MDNDNFRTSPAYPASPASVDMCGLVTESRQAEDAAADRTNASLLTTDESLITEEAVEDDDSLLDEERVVADWDEPNAATPAVTSVGETANYKGPQAEEAEQIESDDQWALSSVASWLSSSVKEATQQEVDIPIPPSVSQLQFHLSDDHCNCVAENDGNDDDDVSIGNLSLASILSSIGYVSAGSKASKSSLGSHSSSRPEAHLLKLPDNLLLDDISTGSVELLFQDDSISIVPSVVAANENQCDQGSAKSATIDVNDNANEASKLPINVSNAIVPMVPLNSIIDDALQQCGAESTPDSSNNPVLVVPITLPSLSAKVSIVSENSSIGKDGWGSDDDESVDIEKCTIMPKQQQFETKDDSSKTPKTLLLDTSDDTASTTNEQHSYKVDDSSASKSSMQSIWLLCKKWSKHFLCYVVFLGIFVSLILVLRRDHNHDNEDAGLNAAALEATMRMPSSMPSVGPSMVPSTSLQPSFVPSDLPSTIPSFFPSNLPSSLPTPAPTTSPSTNPTYQELETVFYAIGDVPYNNVEKVQLKERMTQLPQNGEFLIHVGDIRSGQNPSTPCLREEYIEVRDILLRSEIPVFIIPGDNEWSDCPNPVEGQSYWMEAFQDFEQNWEHPFTVVRDPTRAENFYFVHKRTLYFGVNLVGGDIVDRSKYSIQFKEQFDWVKEIMDKHVVNNDTLSVVIFGHAFPRLVHEAFFRPLRNYIRGTLNDDIPVMYLNGDYHFYDFEEKFMGLASMQRLQVEFGTINPPMKVAVSVSGDPSWDKTFSHDRML